MHFMERKKSACGVRTWFLLNVGWKGRDGGGRDRSIGERNEQTKKNTHGGNDAGAYCHRQNMPPAGERRAKWESGDWDATWYCTGCYMKHYNCSYEAVLEMLGFTRRAAKKACYVNR